MNSLFAHSSPHWVRYDQYELKETSDGTRYVLPTREAKPHVYDPLEHADSMVLDALNVGLLMMKRADDTEIQEAVMAFITNYGLLGLMTALPTTPTFMDYEAVYLPKNNHIKEETLSTEAYLQCFYPFDQPSIKKSGKESVWSITDDREMQALAMTFDDKPMAVRMCMRREYAERYDWLLAQFKDWAFIFYTSIFYYQDGANLDEDTKNVYREAMAAFDGMAPSYYIELREKPTIVWGFHSLLLGIQMMLSFSMTDEKKMLRVCKECGKVFIGGNAGREFCSARCKSQHKTGMSVANVGL